MFSFELTSLCWIFCVFFLHQIYVKKQTRHKAAAKRERKIANLAARPTFTSPSSTPVTTATRMTRSLWRSVGDLR